MVIERFKGIAGYIAARTGLVVTEEQVRKWARRRLQPLPVSRFVGRVFAESHDLDRWIAEQERSGRGP